MNNFEKAGLTRKPDNSFAMSGDQFESMKKKAAALSPETLATMAGAGMSAEMKAKQAEEERLAIEEINRKLNEDLEDISH